MKASSIINPRTFWLLNEHIPKNRPGNQIGAKKNTKTTSRLNFKLHGQASWHRFSSIPITSETMMLYLALSVRINGIHNCLNRSSFRYLLRSKCTTHRTRAGPTNHDHYIDLQAGASWAPFGFSGNPIETGTSKSKMQLRNGAQKRNRILQNKNERSSVSRMQRESSSRRCRVRSSGA